MILMLLGATSTCHLLLVSGCDCGVVKRWLTRPAQVHLHKPHSARKYYLPPQHRLNTVPQANFPGVLAQDCESLFKKKLSCQPSTIPTIPTRLLSSQGCLQFAGAYISPTSEKKLSSKLHPLQFDTWPVTHAPSDLPMMNRSLKAFLKPWSRGTFGISFEIEKPTFWKSFKKKVNLSKNTSFKQLYSCNSSKSRLKHG